MEMSGWQWWTQSDAGLAARICLGAAALAVLAVWDIRRKGKLAQRWREYMVLLAAVGVAMAYGVINDQITAGISWEYFYYGKGLEAALGPQTPPDNLALRLQAVKIGMMATWSVGLVFGVLVLFANNPRKDPARLPQLPYRTLYRLLPVPVALAAAGGVGLGLAGYFGLLTNWSEDFQLLVKQEMFRPHRFMAVYGAHLGGYIGSAVGAVGILAYIRRRRKSLGAPRV